MFESCYIVGMRLIFLGSGEFGLPTLERLNADHQVLAVVSQPDRPAGRKQQLTPTPIAGWAAQRGLPVFKVENANDPAFVAQMAALKPEASIVIAFGQKLSPSLIDALGPLVVNLHASLLPKYRGAAPINWAMIRGEKETGVSVIGLAQRMDAGLIYAQAATPIGATETAGELHDRLAALGPAVIERTLVDFAAGTLRGQAQDDSLATKAPKLSKADATVSFDLPADQVASRVHGLTPWPGVSVRWFRAGEGNEQPLFLRRVRALADQATSAAPGTVLPGGRVACRDGVIELLEVQTPGGRVLPFADFERGHRMAPGDRLTGLH